MSTFFGIAIVFVVVFPFIECLLNQGAASDGHPEKLITELIQNVSRLNQAIDAVSAREQTNMADLIRENIQLQRNFTELQSTMQQERFQSIEHQQRLNQTIAAHQRRIENLEKEAVDHNITSKLQQHRIVQLEKAEISLKQKIYELETGKMELNQTLIDINRTLNARQTEIDNRMNQSFGAYQVILHDIVDKHNHHVAVYNNQSIALNQSVADLSKQFHYLSLSFADSKKEYVVLNASFSGKFIDIINTNRPFWRSQSAITLWKSTTNHSTINPVDQIYHILSKKEYVNWSH